MKNSIVLTSAIVIIFLQISFSASAQSGTVDFKAEQFTSTPSYASKKANVGIIKIKTYVKFEFRKIEFHWFHMKK